MKIKLNPKVEIGDRIILAIMYGENEVRPKTRGTVTGFENLPNNELKILVDWDNGSKLPLLSSVDYWIKVPENKLDEQKDLTNTLRNNLDTIKYFDFRFLLKYLNKVAKSGVVNMMESIPFLWMGSKSIERYYGEGNEDDENFNEMLEMSDEARNKMIQGTIKYMEAENLDISEISKIERQMKVFGQKIFLFYVYYR
jgi:hypothetical protein